MDQLLAEQRERQALEHAVPPDPAAQVALRFL